MLSKDAFFEGNNKIGKKTIVLGKVGFGTYIGHMSKINGDIGRYCSISWNVETIEGIHPLDKAVSTAPCFYSLQKQNGVSYVSQTFFEEYKYADQMRKKAVIIENDVWIGAYAKLTGGITIHNGAVVLAGAIVTHDVPPYAIVGGVPAKIIRYRFNEETIAKLLSFKWWDKNEKWIKQHTPQMMDISLFIKSIESEFR